MTSLLKSAFLLPILLFAGCASERDFVPNGAGANLPPTDPAHVLVLNSVPRGMIIGTVLVDRAKAPDTAAIIAAAREKAAAAGGDFIVWEDSLGTSPGETSAPGPANLPSANSGQLQHDAALPPPEQTVEKSPKARFTVGIFLPGQHGPQ